MKLRAQDIEFLLQRPCLVLEDKSTFPHQSTWQSLLQNKVLLITGAGGSIGSALAEQIAYFSPKQLILLDIYENHLFYLGEKLKQACPALNVTLYIASVSDVYAMKKCLRQFSVDIIFHAAAHKHVPLMEHRPHQVIKNNLGGTMILAQEAQKKGVKHFVLVSSDKAVQVKNAMGLSKWLCEQALSLLQAEEPQKTRFTKVRFGNVLGSEGSVLPLFQKQIEARQPLTLTDSAMKRYFMTQDEAVHLLLQALHYSLEQEKKSIPEANLLVWQMGESVSILSLAERLLSLYPPEVQVPMHYIGRRAGESLNEQWLAEDERVESSPFPQLWSIQSKKKDLRLSKAYVKEARLLLDAICLSAFEEREDLMEKVQAFQRLYHSEE